MPDNSPTLLDGLSDMAFTPLTIRSTFLLLTRLHYSNRENYGTQRERLQEFIWHKDPAKRTLFIDYDYNYSNKPEALEQRPAIFVGTDAFEFSSMVVDNQKTLSETRDAEQYIKRGSTAIILRHIGRSANDALLLADMTSQFYMGVRKLLQERMRDQLLSFEVARILPSRPFERAPEKADQQFTADVVCPLVYNASWWTFRESHLIKTISMETSLASLTLP